MHVKNAIGTEQNVTLWANWRYRRSRYKRIPLYRTDLQEVSGPIRIKLKKLLSGQIVIFRANFFRPVRLCQDKVLSCWSGLDTLLSMVFWGALSVKKHLKTWSRK